MHKQRSDTSNESTLVETILQNLPDAILLLSADNRVVFANRQARQLLNLSAQTGAIPSVSIPGDLVEQLLSEWHRCEQPRTLEMLLPMHTETIWISADFRQLDYEDQYYVQICLRDISQTKDYERVLKQQAATDYLSGLANRRQFREVLDEHASEAIGLAILDIDYFKQINDRYGHLQGDQAIRFLAGKLLTYFRHELCVARLGGEEFAIVLAANDRQSVLGNLEKFRQDVASSGYGDANITMTVSIGLAFKSAEAGDVHEFVVHSDRALYEAKQLGRNRLCVYRA